MIPQLEALARHLVGDGGSPNVFFVSNEEGVFLVTTDRQIAIQAWRNLSGFYPLRECSLEDRRVGVLACVGPESDEPGAPLILVDDRRLLRSLEED